MDLDTVAFRNLDHVPALVPPSSAVPAFTFGWKCYPRRELRTSLVVLSPRAYREAWTRAQTLMDAA